MKAKIATLFFIAALIWACAEPADGNLDREWFAGEIAAFAVMGVSARVATGTDRKSSYTPPTREDFKSDEEYENFKRAYEAAKYLSDEMEKGR